VSVNVAPRHMMRWDFVDRLARHLSQFPKLGAGMLELEILETTAISQFANVALFVEACKALGVAVTIDDFGTGYSSLTYLRQLPVSAVKIDQSFVRGMLDNAQDRAIVQGILALLNALGLTAVAEGVETVKVGDALLAMGCTLAQGYGIAMPMAAKDMRAVGGAVRAGAAVGQQRAGGRGGPAGRGTADPPTCPQPVPGLALARPFLKPGQGKGGPHPAPASEQRRVGRGHRVQRGALPP
jgi:predicted signal transduction protein with EAL and GGDEF domain